MAEALEVKSQRHGDVTVLSLIGVITEDSSLDKLHGEGAKSLIMDVSKIERINSYGIRQWINKLKEIRASVSDLVFVGCPPMFVEQFNMISNFGMGGYVYSFYLPFFNENTDEDKLILYRLDNGHVPDDVEGIAKALLAKERSLDGFEFNDIEDEYFSFLEQQKGKVIPTHCLNVLKSL